MPKRDLKFRYLGDSKSLTKASGRAEKALGGVDRKSRTAGKGIGIMRGGVAKLGAVLGGAVLIGGAAKAIGRAEEMSSAYAATEQIIKQTGGAANLTGGQIKEMATELSLATGVDKKLIIEGQNLLLTFKNIREEVGEGNDIFSRASEIMLDFSALMGTDAKSSALQLGKALNDPIKGIAALSRVGVAFTDVQKEQIRNFQESGDMIGAQNIILAELEGQVGGVAEATADSTAKIGNAWKEVQEQIGNQLLPVIEAIAPAFAEAASAIPSGARNIGVAMSTAQRAFSKFVDVVDVGLGPMVNFTDAWTEQSEVIFQVTRKIGDYEASLRNGITESQAFQGTLLSMAEAGDIHIGTLQELIEQTGISNDAFRDAALVMLRNRDEYGLNETMAADLKRELRKLEIATDDAATATGESVGPLGDLEDQLDKTGGAAKEAAEDLRTLAEKTQELADPVFKAEKATERFEAALEAAQEDLIITQDESEELGRAYGEMVVAQEGVTAEGLEAYEANVTAALQRADAATVVHRGNLAAVPEAALEAFRRTKGNFDELIERQLKIELVATVPSRATMDRAVREALVRARRRGGIDGINF